MFTTRKTQGIGQSEVMHMAERPRGAADESKASPSEALKTQTQNEVAVVRGEVGLTAQSEALAKLLKIDAKDTKTQEIIASLKEVNIPSLLGVTRRNETGAIRAFLDQLGPSYANNSVADSRFRDLAYSADGSLGAKERIAVAKFLEKYINDTKFRGQIDALAPYAEAGLDTTVALRDTARLEKLSTVSSLVEYLGDVPSGRYTKDQVIKTLDSLSKDPNFSNSIGKILGIATPDTASLISAIQKNPALKARFYDAVNANAANGVVGLASFIRGDGAAEAERVTAEFKSKAEKAIADLKKVIDNPQSTPEQRKNAQAAFDAYNKKGGAAWLTGEIQKVAQGAYINIGKNANMAGAGVTYEAFVRGLTVTVGAGIAQGGGIAPVAVVHYDVMSGRLGETAKSTITGNVGVGTSVFPAVIPFIDGGVSMTDKITTLGNGRGGVDSISVNAQLMKVGGVVSLAFMNERADEMAQGQAKLLGAVGKMAELTPSALNETKIAEIIKGMGLTTTPGYTKYWTARMSELYRTNGVTGTTSAITKSTLLTGLINSEVEKSQVEEAQNDKDSKSFKGWSVGIGHIFGVTFPLAGLYWKEGKMTYSPSKMETGATTTVTTKLPDKVETFKFEDLYSKSADGKALTFKKGEAPKSVAIDKALGSYDEKTGVLTLVNPNAVVFQKFEQKDGKLESFAVISAGQAQEKVGTVRNNNDGLPKDVTDAIFAVNRTPKDFPTFNSALLKISERDYAGALTLLQNEKKLKTLTGKILGSLGTPEQLAANPEKLAAILTYTYGVKSVRNSKEVGKSSYTEARKPSLKAEKELAQGRWNDANEAQFAASENHTPTQLSALIPEQELSVTVFATPSGAKHRIDKYNGSLTVSNVLIKDVNEAQKEGIMKDHAAQITSQVSRLQAFVKSGGKDASVITEASYKSMLTSGKIPETWKSLGLDFGKTPVFFEARAMAAGNICMNKTEGIGYPSFTYKNTGGTIMLQRTTPQTRFDTIYNPTGGGAAYGEVVTGLIGSAFSQKPKPGEAPSVTTNPGEEVVTPNPGDVTSTPITGNTGTTGPVVGPPTPAGPGQTNGGSLTGAPPPATLTGSVGVAAPAPINAAPAPNVLTAAPAPVNAVPVPPPINVLPPSAVPQTPLVRPGQLGATFGNIGTSQIGNVD